MLKIYGPARSRAEYGSDECPLWVVSGHSEALKMQDGEIWGRGGVRECLLSARSGHLKKPRHEGGAYTRECLLSSLSEGQDDGDIQSAIHL